MGSENLPAVVIYFVECGITRFEEGNAREVPGGVVSEVFVCQGLSVQSRLSEMEAESKRRRSEEPHDDQKRRNYKDEEVCKSMCLIFEKGLLFLYTR